MKAKNIAILLFSTVIGCAVAKTYTDLQEGKEKTSDVKKERKANVKNNVKCEKESTVEHETESVQTEVVKPSYGEYASLQKSGVVGLYGGNSIDNPEDNIFEVVIPSSFSSSDKAVLSYDVEGVAGSTGVALSINDRTAMGGMVAYSSDKRSSVSEEIDAAWLVKGKNRIMFTLPDSANYGYRVSNLKIAISANTASGNIVATASKLDGEVYVRGFVKNAKAKSVNIAGNEYELTHGSFEALISGDDEDVRITCGDASKTFHATTVSGCIASTRLICVNKSEKQTQKEFSLAKKENNKVQDVAASLDVDSGVVKKDMKITMTNLRHKDLPALDLGMTNVTDGVDGYRFLPHGAHFDGEGAVVSLKYDRTKIPSGYTENDIRTYYFDLDTKHWVALKRDSIDKENNLIVSRTNHFTDMINGVIQAPESPETQGFTPTMMSDLKLADPTAKIQSIAPPTANNRGSANLSYSFEMPPARHGMQPSLGIQYNSDGGTGLLGEGWDLSVPTISVETRWGVPRYDDILETETYLMDGSMLVLDNGGVNYLAHRALNQIKRSEVKRTDGAVIFHPRKEGSFSKIVRLGNSPAEYTWVVTDKSGTKYYYGKKNADGSMKGVLMGKNHEGKDVIAEWKLVRIQEVHGDWIEYEYETTTVGKFSAKSLLLKKVSAGNSGEKAHTEVSFFYKNGSNSPRFTTSGRYGFLTGQDMLLDLVNVTFENEKLRAYTFDYTTGSFATPLLKAVNHMVGKDIVSSNRFEYHDNVSNKKCFREEKRSIDFEKVNGEDKDKIEVYGPDFLSDLTGNLSALGTASSLSGSIDVYGGVGVNDGNLLSKSNTGGVSYTFNYSSSAGAISYMDIDGDGLSDMVFKNGKDKKIYYRPCLQDTSFGKPILIKEISDLSKTSTITHNIGGKGHIGLGDLVVTLGGDYGTSESTTTVYFSDVNGDGLVDFVNEGNVLFNQLKWSEQDNRFVPTFVEKSTNTANPIYSSGVTVKTDEAKKKKLEEKTKENSKQNPMHDVVRVWKAPYNGHVNFSGVATLVGKNSDGVVLSVQKEKNLIKKYSIKDKSSKTIKSDSDIEVKRGDRLFFRVQSGNTYDASGEDDIVNWSPVVSYVENFEDDANGLSRKTYDSEKDFFIQIRNSSSLESKSNYNNFEVAKLVIDVDKKVDLTDDFEIEVVLTETQTSSESESDLSREISLMTYKFDQKKGKKVEEFDNLFEEMKDGYVYSLSCELKTKSNIDFNNVVVTASVMYSNSKMTKTQNLIPGFSIYADNVYYGNKRDVAPLLSQIDNENGGWIKGASIVEASDEEEMSLAWHEDHIISIDKDKKETVESVEVTSPISSLLPEFYIVPQFEYNITTQHKPVRLVVKKDGKCEHITFELKDGEYEPVKLQMENSLLSEYLLNSNGETQPDVWLEYYTDADFDSNISLNKSGLKIFAYHTTEYECSVADENGVETLEKKTSKVTLYESQLENIAYHAVVGDPKFGPMYRNWGQFGYIANEYEYKVEDGSDDPQNKVDVRYEMILDTDYLTTDVYSEVQDKIKDMDPDNVNPEDLPTVDENKNAFVTMIPDAETEMWVGVPKSLGDYGKQISINGIGRTKMESSRYGKQVVKVDDPMSRFKGLEGDGAVAIDLISESSSVNSCVGLSGYSLNVGWNGKGGSVSAFVDMNGDGYPDVIENGTVTYTNPLGGLSSDSKSFSHLLDESNARGLGIGKGHTINMFPSNSKTTVGNNLNFGANKRVSSSEASASFGGKFSREHNDYALVDMNGDGLPDKVEFVDENNGYIKVSLNTGYGFSDSQRWGSGHIRRSFSFSLNGGGDASRSSVFLKKISDQIHVSLFASSISGGISGSSCATSTMTDLRDVNGDGLPDLVLSGKVDIPNSDNFPMNILSGNGRFAELLSDVNGYVSEVLINTGNGFERVSYKVPMLGTSTSNSASLNGNYTAAFPVLLAKVAVTGGGSASGAYSTTDCAYGDFDGDGFADLLESSDQNELKVCFSNIGATNKLKSVTTPFGGRYELEYIHSTPTQQHPGGKWVMSKLTVTDTKRDKNDCPSVITEFDYSGGKRDRRERDFYGFAEVRTKRMNVNEEGNSVVESQIVQNYDVTNYYSAGTVIGSYVCDADQKHFFSKETTEHKMYPVSKDRGVDDKSYVKAEELEQYEKANVYLSIFVAPVKSTTMRFEPKNENGESGENGENENKDDNVTTNIVENKYGNFGNLTEYKYTDGITDASYTTTIQYKDYDEETGVFGLPTEVEVKSNGDPMRHVTAEYDKSGYNPTSMTKMTQYLDKNTTATIEFKYDTLGNIIEKIMPKVNDESNLMKESMKYTYEYDKKYKMYPIRVTDGFGYRSDMFNYDYRYGIPLSVKDMNGFITEYEIDDLGRVTKVIAPNELSSGAPYTIKYEYFSGDKIRMAKTYHYDPQHEDQAMITVNIVDGFGRELQARKSAEIDGDDKFMIVSGKTTFDALGRELSHYAPTTCLKSEMENLTCNFSDLKLDLTTYDAFDRPNEKTVYDEKGTHYVTKMEYSIEDDKLKTTVTDAEGMVADAYTDGTEHTLKTVKKHENGEDPATTKFDFDGIGQLLKVTDPAGKFTEYTYDMAGRKLSVANPSAGTTKFTYDNLGNVLTKTTGKGDVVTYKYEYNRLVEQIYGNDKWKNNVKYTYGGVDAKHNRVGRLALVEDGSGAQEYFYGKMGEVEKIRRTIIIPGVDVATYTTEWKYDSWNRIQEMIYPDGEKIKYYYNLGGQLQRILGQKNYICTYIDSIRYDKYEQRSYIKYGNGTETTYDYDPVNRRLDTMTVSNEKSKAEGAKGVFLNNVYKYDAAGNIISVTNSSALNSGIGGTMTHEYTYDDWYRLKTANGVFESADKAKRAEYSLTMGYDNLYNITSKKLTMSQTNLQFAGKLSAGHEFSYNYSTDNPMQLASVETKQYNVDGEIENVDEALAKNLHTQNYEFDKNGNMISVSVAKKEEPKPETENPEEQQASEDGKDVLKSFLWDEENRLLAVNNNGSVSCYFYDAAGERTVKLTSESEMVHVNGKKVGGSDAVTKFTAYVSPYFVVSNGGAYTKHIYAASQRIASKLGNEDGFGADPRRVEQAGGKKISDIQKDNIGARFSELGFTYTAPEKEKVEKDSTMDSEEPENLVFFYHPDHLGSTSYVTDADGNIAQHVEYIPYGEVFVEERNHSFSTNFLFNAKELDNETGLYYYGARYLDPTGAMWLSVDPMWEKYAGMSPYNYCGGNPVKMVDPDGRNAYLVVWFSENGECGHAGVAIDNYKEIVDKDGKPILDNHGNRQYEPNGTMSFYDIFPGESVGETEYQKDVVPHYSKGIYIKSVSDLCNNDPGASNPPDFSEGRPADGIVQLNTSYEQDMRMKEYANSMISQSKDYNACYFNCSTFSQEILGQAYPQIDGSQKLKLPGYIKLFGYTDATIVCPNNLYNSAMKIRGAKNIKGPKSHEAKPFIEYYGK